MTKLIKLIVADSLNFKSVKNTLNVSGAGGNTGDTSTGIGDF